MESQRKTAGALAFAPPSAQRLRRRCRFKGKQQITKNNIHHGRSQSGQQHSRRLNSLTTGQSGRRRGGRSKARFYVS
jgi:hypothetical protein